MSSNNLEISFGYGKNIISEIRMGIMWLKYLAVS